MHSTKYAHNTIFDFGFEAGRKHYVFQRQTGLKEIVENELVDFPHGDTLKEDIVKAILPIGINGGGDDRIIATESKGLFRFRNDKQTIEPYLDKELTEFFKKVQITNYQEKLFHALNFYHKLPL